MQQLGVRIEGRTEVEQCGITGDAVDLPLGDDALVLVAAGADGLAVAVVRERRAACGRMVQVRD
jgi:hypothetical protein